MMIKIINKTKKQFFASWLSRIWYKNWRLLKKKEHIIDETIIKRQLETTHEQEKNEKKIIKIN
jgi:hypothetical protein